MNIALLLIDPQNDFHDIPVGTGSNGIQSALPVTGACEDAERLVAFLDRNAQRISSVYVTLDSHQKYDIGHPIFWQDNEGNHPAPVTQITADDIRAGRWTPVDKGLTGYTLRYAEALEATGRFKITVWPTHCLVDSWGWQVYPTIEASLGRWSEITGRSPVYKRKGTHYLTEHYGAFAAEYPIDGAPETDLDTALLDELATHDMILVGGQALSHCVGESLRQIAQNWPRELCEKVMLLRDTTSPVPGFEAYADELLADLQKAGIRVPPRSTVEGTSDLLR